MSDKQTTAAVLSRSSEAPRGGEPGPKRSQISQTIHANVAGALQRSPADLDVFVEFLVAHSSAELTLSEVVGKLHLEDLHLVFRCSRGDKEALKLFEKRYVADAEQEDRKSKASRAASPAAELTECTLCDVVDPRSW